MSKDMKKFRCGECGKKFYSRSCLEEHTNVHTGRKPFTCPECGVAYFTKNGLLHHLKNYHPVSWTNKRSSSSESFIPNNRSKSQNVNGDTPRSADCEFCGRSFSCQTSKLKHQTMKHPEKRRARSRPHQCNLCKARLKTRSSLHYHKQIYHSAAVGKGSCVSDKIDKQDGRTKKAEQFHCDKCGRDFSNKSALDRHVVFCDGKEPQGGEEPYKCKTCGEQFVSQYRLSSHETRVHGLSGFKCNVCSKSYGSFGGLRYHLETHKRPFSCDKRGQVFLTGDTLERHKENHNKSDSSFAATKRFKCGICKRSCKGRRALLCHRQSCHTSVNDEPSDEFDDGECKKAGDRKPREEDSSKRDQCEKPYAAVSSVEGRKRVRFQDAEETMPRPTRKASEKAPREMPLKKYLVGRGRPSGKAPFIYASYKCDLCPAKAYTSWNGLNYHYKTVHSTGCGPQGKSSTRGKRKPYTRVIFKSSYQSSAGVRNRLKRHTDGKPLACDVCGKVFKRACTLAFHKTIHASLKEPQQNAPSPRSDTLRRGEGISCDNEESLACQGCKDPSELYLHKQSCLRFEFAPGRNHEESIGSGTECAVVSSSTEKMQKFSSSTPGQENAGTYKGDGQTPLRRKRGRPPKYRQSSQDPAMVSSSTNGMQSAALKEKATGSFEKVAEFSEKEQCSTMIGHKRSRLSDIEQKSEISSDLESASMGKLHHQDFEQQSLDYSSLEQAMTDLLAEGSSDQSGFDTFDVFECLHCRMKLYSRESHHHHEMTHEMNAGWPAGVQYICFKCGRSFEQASSMAEHISNMH